MQQPIHVYCCMIPSSYCQSQACRKINARWQTIKPRMKPLQMFRVLAQMMVSIPHHNNPEWVTQKHDII